MSKKLTNIRYLGAYEEVATGNVVSIRQGRNAQRRTDILYYIKDRQRVLVQDCDFYSDAWRRVGDVPNNLGLATQRSPFGFMG